MKEKEKNEEELAENHTYIQKHTHREPHTYRKEGAMRRHQAPGPTRPQEKKKE